MMKRWLVVPVMVVATMLSGCSLFATSRAATKLEEWGAEQTAFPGARVVRDSWKMGTTGATVHHTVGDLAEAQRFAEGVREAIADVKPRSGRFVGRVEWPLRTGGRVSFEFPGVDEVDEGLWALADSPLPDRASVRRIGWHESSSYGELMQEVGDRTIVEYETSDLVATALAAEAHPGTATVVRIGELPQLGPFPSEELRPRAEALSRLDWEAVDYVKGRDVAPTQRQHLPEAARMLDAHTWNLSGELVTFGTGPGVEVPFDLLEWLVDHDEVSASRWQRFSASGESTCARLLEEAPLPETFELTCRVDGNRAILTGSAQQQLGFLPHAAAAASAGADHVTVEEGAIGVSLPRNEPEAWPGITSALRGIRWEGQWDVWLQGRIADRLEFRSTWDGPATHVQHPRRPSEDRVEDIEMLLASWDDTQR